MPVASRVASFPRSTAFVALSIPDKVERLLSAYPEKRAALGAFLDEIWFKEQRQRRKRQAHARLR